MESFLEVMGIEKLSGDELTMTSPIKLAYLGDVIYEVHIRTYLINTQKSKIHELNKMAVSYVNASSQGYVARNLENFLTEKEWSIIKRGRNQKSTPPKNANVSDYKYATGFEALLGYLYLIGNNNRIFQIIKESIKLIDARSEDE